MSLSTYVKIRVTCTYMHTVFLPGMKFAGHRVCTSSALQIMSDRFPKVIVLTVFLLVV